MQLQVPGHHQHTSAADAPRHILHSPTASSSSVPLHFARWTRTLKNPLHCLPLERRTARWTMQTIEKDLQLQLLAGERKEVRGRRRGRRESWAGAIRRQRVYCRWMICVISHTRRIDSLLLMLDVSNGALGRKARIDPFPFC